MKKREVASILRGAEDTINVASVLLQKNGEEGIEKVLDYSVSLLAETLEQLKKIRKEVKAAKKAKAAEEKARAEEEQRTRSTTEAIETYMTTVQQDLGTHEWWNLKEAQQRELWGFAPFGKKSLWVDLKKRVVQVAVTLCFGMDYEARSYTFAQIADLIARKEKAMSH